MKRAVGSNARGDCGLAVARHAVGQLNAVADPWDACHSLFGLFPVFAIKCRRWERNLKIQTILPLALASLVFGCGGQLGSDEAGLLDAIAFVTGGQEEGAIPQGFETRWRRTVRERKIEYQSIGPNAGFGQANDPHRDSRQVRIGPRAGLAIPRQRFVRRCHGRKKAPARKARRAVSLQGPTTTARPMRYAAPWVSGDHIN